MGNDSRLGGKRGVNPAIAVVRPGVVKDAGVATKPAAGRPIETGPVEVVHAGLAGNIAAGGLGNAISHIDPGLLLVSPLSSLFSAGKPGIAVVRPDDLLALRMEFVNLKVKAGPLPILQRAAAGDAFIILHFPPQSIAEQVFFQTAAPGTNHPSVPNGAPEPSDGNEEPGGPPILARSSGESRLAFKVPAEFSIPYTLADVLAFCEEMAISVPDNALPRSTLPTVTSHGLFSRQEIAKLSVRQRAALSIFSLRNALISAQEGPAATTLQARMSSVVDKLAHVSISDAAARPVFRYSPKPAEPGAHQTAIEMPWRLLLAPHGGERWRHADRPVTSPLTGRTELWHTRLIAFDAAKDVIEPPLADPARTVRAVWALTGDKSEKQMSGTFPMASDLPAADTATLHPAPFRATLCDRDRFQIAHLSSNFSVQGYTPDPVDTKLLMLSSLGGWLDARGAWEPPGLSLEEWAHHASMGRDHYVRVVYKGYLFPLGHRVALIKVSERKFHNGRAGTPAKDGNPAYLRQRMFIVVREPDRSYVDPQLVSADGQRNFQRQFPFNNVRIITTVTPDLDLPTLSQIGGNGQELFWPCVNGHPFAFRCVATDFDNRRVQFELPMIFMGNSVASPRVRKGSGTQSRLLPDFDAGPVGAGLAQAEINAKVALDAWMAGGENAKRRVAQLKWQRVALAPSQKSGDTAAEVETMEFSAEYLALNSGLRIYSQHLSRPIFYPSIIATRVRIAALSQLTGASSTNLLNWNAHYLKDGFDAANKGQVFANVVEESGMAKLDFSTQGDRSGGFVMPNMMPSALSRLTGPVAGDVSSFLQGKFDPAGVFPNTLSALPLPLLFGCIPLGGVIQSVADLTGSPQKIPKFVSEASSQIETFVTTLVRAYEFVHDIGSHGGSLAQAAIDVLQSILDDLKQQAMVLAESQVGAVVVAVSKLQTKLDSLRNEFSALVPALPDGDLPGISGLPPMPALPDLIDQVLPLVVDIATQAGLVTLPSGFKQSLLALVAKAQAILEDIKTLPILLAQGKTLYAAFDAVVGDPDGLGELFSHPDQLAAKLTDIQNAIVPFKTTLAGFKLLEGALRKTLLATLDAVTAVLGDAADLLKLLEKLTGEELVIRFDWNPEIKGWGFAQEADGSVKKENQLFRVNDRHGFLIAVEARVKKSGGSKPKISVVCSLKHFDLVLIAPASFIELNFEKIEFTVDSGAKMNVDVLLNDIKFVGPLSFVETLKDLIPLDGFSDPPHLDITSKGIDAGFSMSLPNIAVGMFSLSNLSLGAGFTVPFIGQPLSVRFNFCTREQPFNLTVTLFGGGGFFGITLDPHGVQILEAAFEFGANIAVDFGVASGGVHVMAGIYFRMEQDAASLTGYFRLGGHVSVLAIITASLELYLELRYEFQTGKCVGRAQLTIEVSVFLFSVSVTITCERKFSGANGDPSFRQMMGINPALSLSDELDLMRDDTQYAWREYCEAFA